ncbi:MAG: response regulator [Bdellovibrionota bacterium]
MINRKPMPILIADDDVDDCQLIKEAFHESRLLNELHFVKDGEELMSYLRRKGKYADVLGSPMPGLILLDLNMPKKDGREVLAEIKADKELRHIPVVVLTTSSAEEDILRTYNLGVNSFVTKPVAFGDLVGLVRDIGHYWFEIVALPLPHEQEKNESR